jgi:hypothetical protein
MTPRDLAFHGLAIKRHATADVVASLMGAPLSEVEAALSHAAATGRVLEVKGGFTLTPLARVALEARYGLLYGGLREEVGFRSAYERFEVVNRDLKQVVTDWQSVRVGGVSTPNDHSDHDYDAKVLSRLAKVHDRIEPVLKALSGFLPRLGVYLIKLTEALERAEDGDIDWVSDVRRESYHTVWFELHEDLLRIMGAVRDE